ncbi:hypothetical protein [Sphingomonas sp. CFBP 8765]|uniref:hypothetical protein n=1 Tax=unclassified Sphingomonas TaxID=196159 RepID=UPI001783FF1E|nr:hypothetical protein [Sphingomonas sp. CFBP 8765]MBD8472228.1 hypothetical protein [Sphingomonas sp. CFBP 8765]
MRAFTTEASNLASRYVGLAALPQFTTGALLLAGETTDEAIKTGMTAGLHETRLHGRRRLSGDLVDSKSAPVWSDYTRQPGDKLLYLYQQSRYPTRYFINKVFT